MAVPGALQAANVVDQAALVEASHGTLLATQLGTLTPGGKFGYGQVQTFTAGITGDLARVDLQLFRTDLPDLNRGFSVRIEQGEPDFFGGPYQMLAEANFTLADLPTAAAAGASSLFVVNFASGNVHLNAGSRYTIRVMQPIQTASTPGLSWAYGVQSGTATSVLSYGPGVSAAIHPNGTKFETAYDHGFRTVISTANAPVPEPATWALLVLGFSVAGVAARRSARFRPIPRLREF